MRTSVAEWTRRLGIHSGQMADFADSKGFAVASKKPNVSKETVSSLKMKDSGLRAESRYSLE